MENVDFNIYLEYPSNNKYIDVFIMSKSDKCKYNIMIELKYIKVSDYKESLVEEKLRDAIEQLKNYALDKRLDNLKKYAVVFVGTDVKRIVEVE